MTTQRNHPALVHGIVDEFAAGECNSVKKTLSVSERAAGLREHFFAELNRRLDAEEARYLGALEGRLHRAFVADPAARG